MPGYAGTLEKLVDVRNEADVELLGETARFYSGRHDGMAVIIVTARFSSTAMAAPIWIAKERDYSDNWRRFAALSSATAQIAANGLGGWRPDVVHMIGKVALRLRI